MALTLNYLAKPNLLRYLQFHLQTSLKTNKCFKKFLNGKKTAINLFAFDFILHNFELIT